MTASNYRKSTRIPTTKAPLLLLYALLAASSAAAFTSSARPASKTPSKMVLEAGKGFGKSAGKGFGAKTYGKVATIKDVIDAEAAMSEFFSSTEEWHPLFQDFADSKSVPAMSFLVGGNTPSSDNTDTFDFDNAGAPWKRLDGIPSGEADRAVLASVLDSMQASLIDDIPVDEQTKEDENDVHFLEEGRRLLAISRFHVLQGVTGGSVDGYDALFSTCWSELMELRVKNEDSTGSLIVLPDYDISDLRRFTDVNLLRPLEWLGVQADFEVTSLQFGSPAIRFIHKLQAMPDEPWNDPE